MSETPPILWEPSAELVENARLTEYRRWLAAERGVELGPPTVFAMGEIAERYQHAMVDLQRRAPAAFARVDGKEWRRLRRILEDARPGDVADADERT